MRIRQEGGTMCNVPGTVRRPFAGKDGQVFLVLPGANHTGGPHSD